MGVGEVFRSANERIAEINRSFDLDGSAEACHEYLCECADLHCTQRIGLTDAEYRAVRAHPLRFLVAPEHVDPAGDCVVERAAAVVVVERAGGSALEVSR